MPKKTEPLLWKRRVWNDPDFKHRNEEGAEYFRDGVIGRRSKSGDVHSCRFHEMHNGSGSSSFGGAQDWPALELHVSFQEGQEARRDELAFKLMQIADEYLKAMNQ